MNGIPPTGVSPWKRANLKSRTGTRIAIDYRVLHQHSFGTEDYWAIDVSFQIDAPSPVSKVGVVVINNYFTNGSFSGAGLQHVYLWHTADHVRFIGSLDEPMKVKQDSTAGYFTVTHAQIAVVLDGRMWQEDPWQWPGCHNFNFDWMVGDVFR